MWWHRRYFYKIEARESVPNYIHLFSDFRYVPKFHRSNMTCHHIECTRNLN